MPVFAAAADAPAQTPKPPVEEVGLPPIFPFEILLTNQLSVPLRLSDSQQERIAASLKKDIDQKIQRYVEQYEKRRAKARSYRFDQNLTRYQMFQMKNNVFDDIRAQLDDLQLEKLDEMIYSGYFAPYAEKGYQTKDMGDIDEVREVTTNENGKKVTEKVIFRKKKTEETKAPEPVKKAVPETQAVAYP